MGGTTGCRADAVLRALGFHQHSVATSSRSIQRISAISEISAISV